MEKSNIEAIPRSKNSNAYLRQLREEGFIPGVLYGHEQSSQPIQLNKKALYKQLNRHGMSSIFQVEIGEELVPVKMNEVQKDAINKEIIHVDLQRVEMDKAIDIAVPIHLTGQAVGVKSGGTIQQQLRMIKVRALPTLIPESIYVDVTDLEIGDSLLIKDIDIPDELEVLNESESVVLTILPPKMNEEEIEGDVPDSEPEIVDAKDGRGIDAAK
ncbi:hypothetical protein BHF71_05150 [Vulcanibacillus modesticaldus]|uniref:Large ribosomal subunit protein bL25 n=1 Tax=Vulcanibacillus modesticaldus TaxID=337097 RepID=A0A1D2YX81_9BACI|nr:50S ribosomal protein L25 [Vulcanibacillus modesticaldus]OEG00292.1 hypothetical protein BHF71_05150 [Vulcanibacillus modesticaldus]